MATRKCGRVTVRCSLVPAPGSPHGEQYKCQLFVSGKSVGTQYVGAPAHLRHALDSAQAFSGAARAAISFALDEKMIDESDVEFSDSGYRLTKPRRRVR